MKKILSIVLLCSMISAPVSADQRTELTRMVSEIDFMIDTAKDLQKKNKNDRSTIRFDYDGLIKQLTVTRNRVASYLNTDLGELRLTPLPPADESLTEIDDES